MLLSTALGRSNCPSSSAGSGPCPADFYALTQLKKEVTIPCAALPGLPLVFPQAALPFPFLQLVIAASCPLTMHLSGEFGFLLSRKARSCWRQQIHAPLHALLISTSLHKSNALHLPHASGDAALLFCLVLWHSLSP